MTIEELAAACDVSTATVNRFVHAIEIDGYAHFRSELAREFEDALAPVEKLRIERSKSATSHDIFMATLYEDERNFELTRRLLTPQVCEDAVKAVLSARRIFIIGFGSSGFLGGLLQRGLSLHCPMVECLAGPGGVTQAARQLSHVQKGDLVIAIAFPRYLIDTLRLTKMTKKAGAQVMALTDKPSSPLAGLADISLFASSQRHMLSNSETAALGMIEALSAAVAHQSSDSLDKAISMTELVMPWLAQGNKEND